MRENFGKMTVTELQAERDKTMSAKQEAEGLVREFSILLDEIAKELRKRLKPTPEPRVSDHALLRYLERVYGFDIEELRGQILSDGAKQALRAGATGYTANGVKFKAKDGVLVTVLN